MSKYEDADRFHNRKHPRLKQYDYATPNYYFVTICTWEKSRTIENIPVHFQGVSVDKYVIMPNHIHAILVLEGETNLATVIGQYKSAVTKEIHVWNPHMKVWQTSFHDHIIRNQEDYARICSYIDTNPSRWMEDCFYTP